MGRKLIAFILTAAAALTLCGCSGWFNKEYLSIKDYVPPAQENYSSKDKISVRNFSGLRQALLRFAYAGENEGRIVLTPLMTVTLWRTLPAPAGRCVLRTHSAPTAWRISPMS